MLNNKDIILRIASSKDQDYAKKVAGAIGWRLREQGLCKVRAIKMTAVNTAVKALAIVNQRIEQANMTMGIDPFFGEVNDGKDEENSTAIVMTIREVQIDGTKEIIEYKVSGKQEVGTATDSDLATKLAGAIAGAVRQGKTVRMRCIGPASVYRAIYAATIAKGFIYPNGYESMIIPTWTTMPSIVEGGPLISLLQLDFIGSKIA